MSGQKLNFTEQGLLVPDAAISTDLGTVEKYFVADFPSSKTRVKLFSNLENYINQLQKEVFPWFEIWIDGSFVTKKENPNDVDVVVVLDYQVFDLKERTLERYYSFNWEKEGIDAYFMREVPIGFEGDQQSMGFRKLWIKRFTNSQSYTGKGFLTLVFKNEVK